MKKLLAIGLILSLTACATPDVVQTKNMNDEKLTCSEIDAEIKKSEDAYAEVQKEKSVTGKNVAAAVFFWPALIATHSNVNDALAALNKRKDHLMELRKAKKCNGKYEITESTK